MNPILKHIYDNTTIKSFQFMKPFSIGGHTLLSLKSRDTYAYISIKEQNLDIAHHTLSYEPSKTTRISLADPDLFDKVQKFADEMK